MQEIPFVLAEELEKADKTRVALVRSFIPSLVSFWSSYLLG